MAEKKKVHLSRPTNERRAMCGKHSRIEETDKPAKVTCLSCKKLYDENRDWYSSTKRKTNAAAKKLASATV